MSFASWIGGLLFGGITESTTGVLQHAAVTYLMVALLAPLSWIVAVELCRRLRNRVDSGEQRESRLSRLAFLISESRKPQEWWLDNMREPRELASGQ